MATLSNIYPVHAHHPKTTSLYSKFVLWTAGQERNRFMWLGIALGVHGCFLTPLTIFAVLLSGAPFAFVIAALGAMALALVTNLAALPTKFTIPAFVLSIVADVLIIAAAILA